MCGVWWCLKYIFQNSKLYKLLISLYSTITEKKIGIFCEILTTEILFVSVHLPIILIAIENSDQIFNVNDLYIAVGQEG